VNRRDLGRLCAAALLGRPRLDAFDYNWKLGIITDQVDLDLTRVLNSFCPKYQLRWAEIRYLNLDGEKRYVYANAPPKELRQIKKQLDDAGVRLSVLDTAIFKIALPGTEPVGESPAYVDAVQNDYGRQMENLKRASGWDGMTKNEAWGAACACCP